MFVNRNLQHLGRDNDHAGGVWPTDGGECRTMRTYPALYQINTRVYVGELSRALGRPATLDDVPDRELERIAGLGFDWVWLLGVWQTGVASRAVSRAHPELRREFERVLPDLIEADICGSCFAITGYTVHTDLGGDEALARLRRRMLAHGLRLMLDFVPNHIALDHPWVRTNPDFFVAGTDADLAREPLNYVCMNDRGVVAPAPVAGGRILAYGRDPYFPGWTDTLQLNYGNPLLHEAMQAELLKIAGQCDGVRCDMAMLLLPDVFARTWGIAAPDFWPGAISQMQARRPEFVFMGEVYWDLEWTLQQDGFDFTYDKRLYDRLRDRDAGAARGHLHADLAFQQQSARFIENHDEPRAAATFPAAVHEAAAVITYLVPGLRLFHQGQLEGRRTFLPVHLCRAPFEPTDTVVQEFYMRLLACMRDPAVTDGTWRLLDCTTAWEGNHSWECFIAFEWVAADDRLLVVVNYADHPSQCYVHFELGEAFRGGTVYLVDRMSPTTYDRDATDLSSCGLYLDLPSWAYHVFALQ